MFLRLTDASIFINRMCYNRSNVRIGKCYCIICQYTGIRQCLNPLFPIFATHNFYSLVNFFFGSYRNSYFCNLVISKVNGFIRKFFSHCFQNAGHGCSVCQSSSWSSHTVNNHLYLTPVVFNGFNYLLFHLFGKSVSIERFCIVAILFGKLFKRFCIIPTGRSGSLFRCLFLKGHTNGVCAIAICHSNTTRQTIAGRRTNNQYFLWSLGHSFFLTICNLSANTFLTSNRMSRRTDKSFYLWFYYHNLPPYRLIQL